jgi:hypothetical protein
VLEEVNAHDGKKRINAVRINARIKKHGNIVKGYKYLFIALLPGFL